MGLNRREEGPFYHNGEGHGRPVSEMRREYKRPETFEEGLQRLYGDHGENPGGAQSRALQSQIERAIHPDDSTRIYHRDQNPHGRTPAQKRRR